MNVLNLSKSHTTYIPYQFKFKTIYSEKQRYNECFRIRQLYPDRVPIIVETCYNSNIPILDKTKYLVPNNLTVGQFMHVIRNRLKLSPEKSIYFFINGSIPCSSSLIFHVYELYKDEADNFLYILINGENTFG